MLPGAWRAEFARALGGDAASARRARSKAHTRGASRGRGAFGPERASEPAPDADRALLGVAQFLIELSRRREAPAALLWATATDFAWFSSRFQLLAVTADRDEVLVEGVRRSLHEGRRPISPH
ncbi:MAG: hypothetical protein U0414_22870 [Polyangiaceae bacterium]